MTAKLIPLNPAGAACLKDHEDRLRAEDAERTRQILERYIKLSQERGPMKLDLGALFRVRD